MAGLSLDQIQGIISQLNTSPGAVLPDGSSGDWVRIGGQTQVFGDNQADSVTSPFTYVHADQKGAIGTPYETYDANGKQTGTYTSQNSGTDFGTFLKNAALMAAAAYGGEALMGAGAGADAAAAGSLNSFDSGAMSAALNGGTAAGAAGAAGDMETMGAFPMTSVDAAGSFPAVSAIPAGAAGAAGGTTLLGKLAAKFGLDPSSADIVSQVAGALGISASSLGTALGIGANVAGGAIASGAAKSAGSQIAAGAQGAADIMSPAYTNAASTVAGSRTNAANTLASGATTAAAQRAAGASTAANTLSQGDQVAAQQAAQGVTDAGGTLAGGFQQAAGQQVAGLNKAQGAADATLAAQHGLQQPWQQAGTSALNTLSEGLTPGGKFNTPFSMADMGNVMPAYTFARDQALEAVRNQMASGGQALSANATDAAGKTAAGIASQYEQQAFNQWLQQNNLSLGALQNMVNTGQISTSQLSSALAAAGFSTQQIQTAIGAAQGAGTLGAAKATANAQADAARLLARGNLAAFTAQANGQSTSANDLAAGTVDSSKAIAGGQTGSADATAQGILGSAGAQANAKQLAANANAAGTVGSANAITTALGNTGDTLIGASALNSLRPTPAPTAAPVIYGMNGNQYGQNSFDDGSMNALLT